MGMMGGFGPMRARDAEETSTPTATARCRRTRSTLRSTPASRSSTPTRTAACRCQEFEALWAEITKPMAVRAFQFLDPNGDAQVTKAELDDRFGQLVSRFDRNGDGVLSPADRPRHAARPAGMAGGGMHGDARPWAERRRAGQRSALTSGPNGDVDALRIADASRSSAPSRLAYSRNGSPGASPLRGFRTKSAMLHAMETLSPPAAAASLARRCSSSCFGVASRVRASAAPAGKRKRLPPRGRPSWRAASPRCSTRSRR